MTMSHGNGPGCHVWCYYIELWQSYAKWHMATDQDAICLWQSYTMSRGNGPRCCTHAMRSIYLELWQSYTMSHWCQIGFTDAKIWLQAFNDAIWSRLKLFETIWSQNGPVSHFNSPSEMEENKFLIRFIPWVLFCHTGRIIMAHSMPR